MSWTRQTLPRLPEAVCWERVAQHAEAIAQRPYPPERLWLVSPEGELTGQYDGDARRVEVPFLELGRLYQAVLLHWHPPGAPPTLSDTYQATIASSPLLVVFEGEHAHLVRVWHATRPGLMGALMEAEAEPDDLAEGLRAVQRHGGIASWERVHQRELGAALERVASAWHAFREKVAHVPVW